GHPVAFRFVHITLSQGRKVGMVGCRLAAWVAALAQGDRCVSGDGMTAQLGLGSKIKRSKEEGRPLSRPPFFFSAF
ncbi:hypothetical protein, partial [Amycolatopsis tucumanensis]|uniref:hypothetical protein n=1 Tax=Amycolatopsis tucumanensis TaxID=401106 RepID=UPI001F30F8FC